VQINQTVKAFFARQSRWAIDPLPRGAAGEFVRNRFFFPASVAFVGALVSGRSLWAWAVYAAVIVVEMALTQIAGTLTRGYGFKCGTCSGFPFAT